jgi:hypothetical protein
MKPVGPNLKMSGGAVSILSFMFHGRMPEPSVIGCPIKQVKILNCPPKPNGKRPPGVRINVNIPGITDLLHATWPIIMDVSTQKRSRWVHARTGIHFMRFMTWPGMCGNGVKIYMIQDIIQSHPPIIPMVHQLETLASYEVVVTAQTLKILEPPDAIIENLQKPK